MVNYNIVTAFFNHNPKIKSVTGFDGGSMFVAVDHINSWSIFGWTIPGLRRRTGTAVTVNEWRASESQSTFYKLRKKGDNREPGQITLSR